MDAEQADPGLSPGPLVLAFGTLHSDAAGAAALRLRDEAERPVLLDVAVNRQELALPPKITIQQAHGFTLWMLKAVLNNRGNELSELAKTNPIR